MACHRIYMQVRESMNRTRRTGRLVRRTPSDLGFCGDGWPQKGLGYTFVTQFVHRLVAGDQDRLWRLHNHAVQKCPTRAWKRPGSGWRPGRLHGTRLDDRFLEHGVSLTAEAGGECP